MYKENDGGNTRGKDHQKSDQDQPESSWRRNNSNKNDKGNQNQKGKKKFNKRKVQCYRFQKFGHFASARANQEEMMMKLIWLKMIVLMMMQWF